MRRRSKLNIPSSAIMEIIFQIAFDFERKGMELAIGEPGCEVTLVGRTVQVSDDSRSEQTLHIEFSVYDATGHLEPVEEIIRMDYRLTDLIAFCAGVSLKLQVLATLDWHEDNKN